MDSVISNGGIVFVHCHQGISRSSAMLILYLMWKNNTSFYDTHEFVKARREICNPNAGFICQLLSWWTGRLLENKKFRFFIVTPHRKDCPDIPALREFDCDIKNLNFSLDPRFCYIFYDSNEIFYWKGNLTHRFLRKSARRYIKLLQRFDKAPNTVLNESQGNESELFSDLFPNLVLSDSIKQIPENDQYFELLELLPKQKQKS